GDEPVDGADCGDGGIWRQGDAGDDRHREAPRRRARDGREAGTAMNVLVTTEFEDALLDRMRAVSPDLRVTRGDGKRVDYSDVDAPYGNAPPRAPAKAPRLKWAQLHMAGPDSLHDHPVYTKTDVALTTTSGVHAATVAEYAITAVLALAHRVPRMVEWKRKGGWPPD